MTTEYNNEVYMNPVPTGFGSYTGVSIFNRSAKSVTYVAEMSETVLYKAGDVLLPEAEAANQNLYNTLFVSSDLTDVNTSLNETVLTLGAGESRLDKLLWSNLVPSVTFVAGLLLFLRDCSPPKPA